MPFQFLNNLFHRRPSRQIRIAKLLDHDTFRLAALRISRRRLGFAGAAFVSPQKTTHPTRKRRILFNQPQDRPAASDLDVIAVPPKAQNALEPSVCRSDRASVTPLPRRPTCIRAPDCSTLPTSRRPAPSDRRSIPPFPLNVSMHAQNPCARTCELSLRDQPLKRIEHQFLTIADVLEDCPA